jgi:hypothetical protein
VDNKPSMDDAGEMASTPTRTIRICLLGLLLPAIPALLIGCGETVSRPPKMVKSPAGGEVVLTSAERTDLAAGDHRQPQMVAPALFQQPVEAPTPEPELKPFGQWTEQEAAADALGRIGPAGVPALAQALQSRDPEVRLKATEVLGRMGEDAKDAVPELVRLLDDPDLAVRKAAARTIGRIGPAAKDAVPALMRSLLQTAPQPPTTPAAPAP